MAEKARGEEDAELARLREEKIKRYLRLARAKQKGAEYPEKPVDLTIEDSASFLKRYPLALLEFWAAWCRPCLKMRPLLEELAAEYWGDIAFGRISLDAHQEARERFEVTVLPTLLLFQEGHEIQRLLGGVTRPKLEKALEPFAKAPEEKVKPQGHTRPPGAVGG
jgi:thioredoxin 1